MQKTQKNKSIVKNTTLLYFRMLLIMAVNLYTVRVVFNTLGIEDYGIYNVVGSIVNVFSFFSASMVSGSQRFFAFEIGRKNFERLKQIFSINITFYVIVSLIILVLAETIGLWYLNSKLTIPLSRVESANWVFQFTIISFLLTIITIPYNAAIIAHEEFSIYAYFSVFEVILKLLLVFSLVLIKTDKLTLYAFLMFLSTSITTFGYRFYCSKKFQECSFQISWNKTIFLELIGYSGWNLIGVLSYISKNEGINLILNFFFGPLVNAARSLAIQINNVLNSFITNLYLASRPQITKAYASNEIQHMWRLVFQSTKISFFLLLFLSMPLLVETEFILKIWLKQIPDFVIIFVRLFIVNLMIEVINNQLVASLQAANKIKTYQLIVSTINLLNLPISFFLLKNGSTPISPFVVSISLSLVSFIPQILIVKKSVNLPIEYFVKNIVITCIFVAIIAFAFPLLIHNYFESGMLRFFIVCLSSIFFSAISIWIIGLNREEKRYIKQFIYNKINNQKI